MISVLTWQCLHVKDQQEISGRIKNATVKAFSEICKGLGMLVNQGLHQAVLLTVYWNEGLFHVQLDRTAKTAVHETTRFTIGSQSVFWWNLLISSSRWVCNMRLLSIWKIFNTGFLEGKYVQYFKQHSVHLSIEILNYF